jgi:hypothetical protein
MSRRFLMAAALGFATGVALLSAAPAHADEPTAVQFKQGGTKLNIAIIDTENSSDITIVQEGENNRVDSRQGGSVNALKVKQAGDSMLIDADMDGEKNTVVVEQISDGTQRRGAQSIQRALVDGNYFTVYNNGEYSIAEVTGKAPQVGRLGR